MASCFTSCSFSDEKRLVPGAVVGMLVVVFLDGTQAVHHAVAALFHLHLDALDDAHEVARLESLVHLADEVLDVVFRSRQHRGIHADALEDVGVLVVDAADELADFVLFHEVVQLLGKAEVLPVLGKLGLELEGVVFVEMAGEEVHFLAQAVLQRHVLAVRTAQLVNQFQTGTRRVDFHRDRVLRIENVLMRLVPVVGRNLAVCLGLACNCVTSCSACCSSLCRASICSCKPEVSRRRLSFPDQADASVPPAHVSIPECGR